MKRWALVVVALYALVFAALTVPVIVVCFGGSETTVLWGSSRALTFRESLAGAWGCYKDLYYWIFFCVLLLCEAALLLVPVRVASRRPVGTTPIYLSIIVSGLLAGALLFGLMCALWEFFTRYDAYPAWQGHLVYILPLLAWAGWIAVFSSLRHTEEPAGLVQRQIRLLLRGSILELLVAVPCHVLVRQRHECCGGIATFIGIAVGLAVMLLSFGPGVFFLFAERWRRLHPQRFPAQPEKPPEEKRG